MHDLSAPGSRIAADRAPSGASVLGASVEREVASRGGEAFTAIWAAGQQNDPASWLLGHGWTADVSRVSWIARAYGRPMTELRPENLRVIRLFTGELRE